MVKRYGSKLGKHYGLVSLTVAVWAGELTEMERVGILAGEGSFLVGVEYCT